MNDKEWNQILKDFTTDYYKSENEMYLDSYRAIIYELIEEIQKQGLDVNIQGRIKSYQSLFENLKENFKENTDKDKNLHDWFGIKIITNSKTEIAAIKSFLAENFHFDEKKDVKNFWKILTKDYNATHITIYKEPEKEEKKRQKINEEIELIKNQANKREEDIKRKEHLERILAVKEKRIPLLIEVQLCTKEEERKNNEGNLAHDKYKYGKNLERFFSVLMDLPQEKLEEHIPTYYVVEDGEIRILNEEESLRKMFPSISKEEFDDLYSKRRQTVKKSFREDLEVDGKNLDYGKDLENVEKAKVSNIVQINEKVAEAVKE